jgi:hypothetical protein
MFELFYDHLGLSSFWLAKSRRSTERVQIPCSGIYFNLHGHINRAPKSHRGVQAREQSSSEEKDDWPSKQGGLAILRSSLVCGFGYQVGNVHFEPL